VADGRRYPGPRRRLDQLGRTVQFGGDGDDAQVSAGCRPESLEGGHVGSEQVPRVLGAASGRGKERPLQMESGQDAAGGQRRQHGGPGFEFGHGRGHQAGHQGGGAVAAVKFRGTPGLIA
jgi:hypothetical protein